MSSSQTLAGDLVRTALYDANGKLHLRPGSVWHYVRSLRKFSAKVHDRQVESVFEFLRQNEVHWWSKDGGRSLLGVLFPPDSQPGSCVQNAICPELLEPLLERAGLSASEMTGIYCEALLADLPANWQLARLAAGANLPARLLAALAAVVWQPTDARVRTLRRLVATLPKTAEMVRTMLLAQLVPNGPVWSDFENLCCAAQQSAVCSGGGATSPASAPKSRLQLNSMASKLCCRVDQLAAALPQAESPPANSRILGFMNSIFSKWKYNSLETLVPQWYAQVREHPFLKPVWAKLDGLPPPVEGWRGLSGKTARDAAIFWLMDNPPPAKRAVAVKLVQGIDAAWPQAACLKMRRILQLAQYVSLPDLGSALLQLCLEALLSRTRERVFALREQLEVLSERLSAKGATCARGLPSLLQQAISESIASGESRRRSGF